VSGVSAHPVMVANIRELWVELQAADEFLAASMWHRAEAWLATLDSDGAWKLQHDLEPALKAAAGLPEGAGA